MSQEITVDFSEKVVEIENKIDILKNLTNRTNNQKKVLEDFNKNQVPLTKKYELILGGILKCSINISVELLILLLEQNVEDNTFIIQNLAKELGIEVK
ncbi:DUF1359 domain-containing protein [Lactococcus lactis]|uniref:DUF1359 domain-containing protein n=1 Tax=Lactococcus lactis TaxID=1358 RepID=UPI001912CE4D|nr:DUF1359 domain-containing protein [Lactococcus lactis]WDA69254.1 DUF1359 domain-containing protein [Lactococcus lactis]